MIVCSHVYMPWWSYAPMSTCFDDLMVTCMYTPMLICLDTLMITCSYTGMLSCLHVLTCLVSHKFFHAHMLGCSLAWLLTCLDSHMFECSHVHMLWWSHAPICTCPYALSLTIACSHSLTLWWSPTPMLTRFNYPMLPCSYPLMITFCLTHIHWYSFVWYPYTRAHTWMMIYLYAGKLKWLCNWTFMRSIALTIVIEC